MIQYPVFKNIQVLSSAAVMKLGFGFREDIRMLRKSFSHCFGTSLEMNQFLDLESFCTKDPKVKAFLKGCGAGTTTKASTPSQLSSPKLKPTGCTTSAAVPRNQSEGTPSAAPELENSTVDTSPTPQPSCPLQVAAPPPTTPLANVQKAHPFTVSLSSLVNATLQLHMDKSPRMSNWENRPLSNAQLQYAALDAISLLHIFEKLHVEVPDLEKSVLNFTKLFK